MPVTPDFTPAEQANFLAGQAVAYATRFLDDRSDAERLAKDADSLQCALVLAAYEPNANRILDPTRLLVIAMSRASLAESEARFDRWRAVMSSLVGLVRHESRELRDARNQGGAA